MLMREQAHTHTQHTLSPTPVPYMMSTYTCIQTPACTQPHTYTHTPEQAHIHTLTSSTSHTHTHTHTPLSLHLCLPLLSLTGCQHTQAHTHIHTITNSVTHKQAHTHTHTHSNLTPHIHTHNTLSLYHPSPLQDVRELPHAVTLLHDDLLGPVVQHPVAVLHAARHGWGEDLQRLPDHRFGFVSVGFQQAVKHLHRYKHTLEHM